MKLKIKHISVIGIILIVGVLGFIGYRAYNVQTPNNETNSVPQKQDTPKEQKKDTTGTLIKSGDSEFGAMLFNDKGQAIYIFELEESTKAECYGGCAEAWPPVLTDGSPIAAGSVSKELLGTTKRTDGSTQVTYNGHPLYYYAHEKPGEVKCHNIKSYGGLWWVIHPNGIRAD